MRADIEPGPIEHRLNVRSPDGQIRRDRRAIEHEQAQADAREYALPGSAAAVHRVGVSSASIPAISFVITAIIPARNHPGNEVRSELPIVAVKSQIETAHNSFPTTYCKSFATTRKNAGDDVEWHRLVTRVQHRVIISFWL